MVATKEQDRVASELVGEHITLAQGIASRLHRWYNWVAMEDLTSYAYLGLTLAARTFESDRGIPFANFASRKGMYLAIDEMRKDGVLRRRRTKALPTMTPLTPEIPDPSGDQGYQRLERRDICENLLKRLRQDDRHLLVMYYGQELTFKEIAKVFEISESAVCLRHKALIKKLRKMAAVGRVV
jgi:RNA polymerase sigma factor (sigma-70 family)